MARRGASSPTRLLLRRFRHHRTGMVGLGLLLTIVAVAIFAPLLATHDPDAQSELINHGPTGSYWLGTDDLGRDFLARVMYGARSSLLICAGIVALAVAIALPLALTAGYRGGRVDSVISRL